MDSAAAFATTSPVLTPARDYCKPPNKHVNWSQVEKDAQRRFHQTYVYNFSTVPASLQFEQSGADDVGLSVWDGGVVLAQCIESMQVGGLLDMRGKVVVELGAGTGIVGAVCAVLGACAVLTDLPGQVLELMEKNISLNKSKLFAETHLVNGGENTSALMPGSCHVEPLDWFCKEHSTAILAKYPRIDYILLGEVTYRENLIEPLLDSLSILTASSPKPVILMSHGTHRVTPLIQFFKGITKEYQVEAISKTMIPAEYRSQAVYLKRLVAKEAVPNNLAPNEWSFQPLAGGNQDATQRSQSANRINSAKGNANPDSRTIQLLDQLQQYMEKKAVILEKLGALEWQMCEMSAQLSGEFQKLNMADTKNAMDSQGDKDRQYNSLLSTLQSLPEQSGTLLQQFGHLEWECCELLAQIRGEK